MVDFELEPFGSVLFGRYWSHIITRFPIAETEDSPSFTAADEKKYGRQRPIEFVVPPLRNVTFESANRTRLIQLQPGRFSFAWNKAENDQVLPEELEYPRYDVLSEEFQHEWTEFRNWSLEELGVPLMVLRTSLSYRNAIGTEFGWNSPSDNARFFTLSTRLPGLELRDEHYFADYKSEELGRLLVVLQDNGVQEVSDAKPATREYLDLRAETDRDAVDPAWFNTANKTLNDAFASTLTEEALKHFDATKESDVQSAT